MRVTPVSEAEAAVAGLIKRGLYDFEVLEATEKESQAGNEMIEMKVKIYDANGKWRTLYDYLVSSEGMAYKVRHFSSAAGLLPQYEKGELKASDCVGRTGRCQIGIQKGKDGYPDKNNIQDYLIAGAPTPAGVPTSVVLAPDKELDDEIPF